MPIYLSDNGNSIEYDAFLNQGGNPVAVDIYENQGGTPTLLYTPKTVIESFESGTLSGYTTGSTGSLIDIGVVNDPVVARDGEYYLSVDATSNAGGGSAWAWEDASGLENAPVADETFRSRVYFNRPNGLAEVSYGLQNTTGDYPPGFKALVKDGRMYLRYTRTSGSTFSMAETTIDMDVLQDEWLTFEVYWNSQQDGKHVFTIYREDGTKYKQILGDTKGETVYQSGGFGFRGGKTISGDVSVQFDDAYIAS